MSFRSNDLHPKPFVPSTIGLERIVDDLDSAETIEQVAGIFVRYPREFGFDTASIIILDEGHKQFLTRRVLTSIPAKHRVKMQDPSFLSAHPIIEKLRAGSDHRFFPNDTAIESTNLSSDASDGQIFELNGVAFKLQRKNGLKAAVFLNTFKKTPWSRVQYRDYSLEIHDIAVQFIDAMQYFTLVGRKARGVLTADELRFLRLVATNDNLNAAKHFDYSFGSAMTISTSISRKLGVKSLFQAVSIATKLGLLNLEIIDESDIIHHESGLSGWE